MSRVNKKYNKEGDSSSDEDGGKSDGTDAVEYSSCQHPVVLHLILLVVLTALLLFFVSSSLKKIPDFSQLFTHRLDLLCFCCCVIVVVAVTDFNAQTTFLKCKFH